MAGIIVGLIACAVVAAFPAFAVLLATGDLAATWTTFGAVFVGMVVLALLSSLAQFVAAKRGRRLDDSADITNSAYQIRTVFGKAAQAEFLDAVSVPLGQNSNECRFRRGQNRQTMAAKEREIRCKYKPLEEWRPRQDWQVVASQMRQKGE